MKKILSFVLCLILMLGVTGCGAESNLSNKEYEKSIFRSENVELEEYDSEVFYADDREINYTMLDDYKSVKKEITKTNSSENYELGDKEKVFLSITLYDSSLYDDYYKIYEDAEENNEPADGLMGFLKRSEELLSESFEGKTIHFDEEVIQVGDYEVYTASFKDNTLGEDGSESTNLIATFEVDEKYVIGIEMSTFIKNSNSSQVSVENIKKLIETFKSTNY